MTTSCLSDKDQDFSSFLMIDGSMVYYRYPNLMLALNMRVRSLIGFNHQTKKKLMVKIKNVYHFIALHESFDLITIALPNHFGQLQHHYTLYYIKNIYEL